MDPTGVSGGPRRVPAAAAVGAVVLCGGTSARMGGADKTAAALGGTTVLDRLLDSLPPGWPVVCVGVERPTTRHVTWVRESPPGGGPVAGMACGLAALSALGPPAAEPHTHTHVDADAVAVVLAGDLPFAGQAALGLAGQLAGLPADVDAVVGTDGDGRAQPLLAAYRSRALRSALPADPAGAPMMGVLGRLRTRAHPVDQRSALDVDTPAALGRARHMVEP